MFFCCKICHLELRNLVLKIKQSTGWEKIDELNIEGSYAGRNCLARAGEKSASFLVTFDSLGEVQTFNKLPK